MGGGINKWTMGLTQVIQGQLVQWFSLDQLLPESGTGSRVRAQTVRQFLGIVASLTLVCSRTGLNCKSKHYHSYFTVFITILCE